MAQSDCPDLAVAVDRVADAGHRVGEVDEPGIRAGLLHIAHDLHQRADIARGVGKAAGAAVLSVGLAQAVLERDLVIGLPQLLARTDFDGRDNELRILERICDDEYAR